MTSTVYNVWRSTINRLGWEFSQQLWAGDNPLRYFCHPLDKVIGHLLGDNRVLLVVRMRCEEMSNPSSPCH